VDARGVADAWAASDEVHGVHPSKMELHGEEIQKVEQMVHRFHIHDVASANESIHFLEQRIKEGKDEVATLQKKSMDLDQADDNLAKAERLIGSEKETAQDSLSELIRENAKDRKDSERRLEKRMKKLRELDESIELLEEQEILGQEKVAKKQVELELLQADRADELDYEEDELRKKGEHISLT